MKKAFFVCAVFVLASTLAYAADLRVKGHYRDSDGDGYKETYVQPYYRTAPDNNPYNNYSSRGNTNPYTGQRGNVDPYYHSSQPQNNNYNTKSLYK